MAKEGSTVSGLMDTLATMTSMSLQYGVPLRDLVNKFAHMRFEPAGFTGNSEIPIAKSIVDYVFRWMGSRFLSKDERDALGIINRDDSAAALAAADAPVAPAAGHRVRGRTCCATLATNETKETNLVGEAGGPKASAGVAEPPPAEPVGGTDLPVLSNGHSANGHATSPTARRTSPISRWTWVAARRSRSASRPTHRPAPTAARSWSATAAATSA